MMRVLQERGYKPVKVYMDGRQRRVWKLEGRYCNICQRNVDRVSLVPGLKDERRFMCEDCLQKQDAPEPF